MYPAAKGLPGKEVDPVSPLFAVVSRYHRVILENGVQEVPPTSTFFFGCSSLEERDRWLTAYFINAEWALRFSGLFYPRGTARVEYSDSQWRLKVNSDNAVRYLKSSRLHVSAKIDGTVFKKGSKFASAWKTRYAALKGQCTLEYYSEKGGESLGKLNMSDGRVVLVCNDTLTPPTMASTKEKLSNLKGKIAARRTSIAVPLEEPTKEEKLENLLWFAILSPGRVWLFRAANLEDLERWMFSMEDRCNDFKQAMAGIKTVISQAEKQFQKNPIRIRYRLHQLNDAQYPMLERAAIPGRPMSGQFNADDVVRGSRSMSAVVSSSSKPSVVEKDPELNLYDETLDDFELDYDSLKQNKPQPKARAPQVSPRGAIGTRTGPGGSNSSPNIRAASPRGTPSNSGKPKPALPPQKKRISTPPIVKEQIPLADEDVWDDEDLADEDEVFKKPAPSKGASRSNSNNNIVSGGGSGDAELAEKTQMLANLQKQFDTLREELRGKKLEGKKHTREMQRLKEELEEARSSAMDGGGGIDVEEFDQVKADLLAEQEKVKKLESQV